MSSIANARLVKRRSVQRPSGKPPPRQRGNGQRRVRRCRQVAVHRRSYGPERFVLEPQHYLPLLERKPGALDQARPFQGNPWGEDFTLLRRELEYRLGEAGTRQFIRVLLLMTEHAEEEVRAAVGSCVRRRAFSAEAETDPPMGMPWKKLTAALATPWAAKSRESSP